MSNLIDHVQQILVDIREIAVQRLTFDAMLIRYEWPLLTAVFGHVRANNQQQWTDIFIDLLHKLEDLIKAKQKQEVDFLY